jgi:PAS domain S-box-containing protein
MTHNNKNKTGDQKSPVLFNPDLLDQLIYPASVITSKSILVYANAPFMKFFGIDAAENRFDWPNVVNPEHKKFVGQTLVNAFNGSFSSCQVEVKKADDESLTVEVLMQPLSINSIISNVMIFIKPLENYRTSRGEQAELQNNSYYEFSPLPLMRFNRDFQILTCSRSFEGTIGYKAEELSKKSTLLNSLFKYDSEKIKNHITEILKGNIPFKRMGEIKVINRDGDEKLVNIIIYPVMREKEIIAADLIMEDITRVRDLKERLNTARRLNLVSDIGRGFIHSINNTLNVILNQTQLLQIITEKGTVFEGLRQMEKYVHEVIDQLRRIVGFINENGNSSGEKEESFERILDDAIEFIKIHFKIEDSKKKRSVIIEKIPGYEMSLKTDTGFLRELLIWAMLKVSAYAGKKGKIEVELKKASFVFFNVLVNKQEEPERDNIVPYTLDAFSPSEIRSAAEKLNLKILEEESAGQYSIKIIFPRNMIIDNTGNDNNENGFVIEDKDIMVVEDEQALQAILGDYFERMGNRIYITDNGSEAFTEFKRKNYDILIADYDVSGISGIELSARVKEINEDTVTVLLSGWPLNPKGYTGFIDLFMAKPFNIEDLVKGIMRINSTEL